MTAVPPATIQPLRRGVGWIATTMGFVLFPWCLALGYWGERAPDDLRGWRSSLTFWAVLFVPPLVVGYAARSAGSFWAPPVVVGYYVAAAAIIQWRRVRRRSIR